MSSTLVTYLVERLQWLLFLEEVDAGDLQCRTLSIESYAWSFCGNEDRDAIPSGGDEAEDRDFLSRE